METRRGKAEEERKGERARERGAFHRVDSRDDSPGLVKPSGDADIEFMVTMEMGPEGTTFVRFIPYSRGYVINAVPMSSLTSPLTCAFCPCIVCVRLVEIYIFLNSFFNDFFSI